MNRGGAILDAMQGLIRLFEPHCADRTTLSQLNAMIGARSSWKGGHSLFQKIRAKTLEAQKRGDALMESQFRFEEMCAKTLYNLSGESAPFDADSPYWIIPGALEFARKIGVADNEIIAVAAQQAVQRDGPAFGGPAR